MVATMREKSLPFQPKATKRRWDANSVILLLPNEDTSTHQVRSIRFPATLLRQHLAPNGVTFPSDMLSLMDLELLYSGVRVISCDTFGVQRNEAIDCGSELVLGSLQEGVSSLYNVVSVLVFEL